MPTVVRLRHLPTNFDRYIEEVAAGMAAVYGPPAAAEYRDGAKARVRATLSHPGVLAIGTASPQSPTAMAMAIVHESVGQIFFLHALDGAGPDALADLIEEAVRSLRAGGVDGILCETVVVNPSGPMPAFDTLGFECYQRSIMRGPLENFETSESGAAEIVQLSAESADEMGTCLATAYADDPGADLHREMRASDTAASFTESVIGGAFGRFEPGYALGIRGEDGLAAVLLGCEPVAKVGFIVQVATRPECRGRGYARRLLAAAAERFADNRLESMALGVTDTNPAVGLYEQLGLQRVWPVHAYAWWRP